MQATTPASPFAADRTVLAVERTYAAWVRTGLVSLAAGVGARTSLGSTLPEWALLFFTSRLVLFSAFFAVAVWRDLRPGHDSPPHSNVWRISPGVLLVAFSALLGVWFGRTGGG